MFENLPTQRISPKNQVTLPRAARGLNGAETDGFLCAMPHRMRLPSGEPVPVLVLMPEAELHKREDEIRAKDLEPMVMQRQIARLNGHVRQLAIDAQRRVVLPPHFVSLLKLEKEVFMFSNNNSVLVWNPADWIAYSDSDEDDDEDLFVI